MTTEKLNARQRLFVSEYLKDLNATQAAIRAGYSEKTAYAIGAENLKKPEIAAAIRDAQDARAARTLVTADWIVLALKEVAERCMQRVPVMIRVGKEMVQKTEENENGEEVGVWEFDSAGANRALQLLGQHKGLFSDAEREKDADLVNLIRESLADARAAGILPPSGPTPMATQPERLS